MRVCTAQRRHRSTDSCCHALGTQPESLKVKGHRVCSLGFVNAHAHRHRGGTSGLNFPQGGEEANYHLM